MIGTEFNILKVFQLCTLSCIVDDIKFPYVLGFHKNFNFWKLNVSERNYALFRKINQNNKNIILCYQLF